LLRDFRLLNIEVRAAKLGGEEGRCAYSLGEFQVVIEICGIRFRDIFFRLPFSDVSAEIKPFSSAG
jgi:hypothetical protein